jgi:hypothetical protein
MTDVMTIETLKWYFNHNGIYPDDFHLKKAMLRYQHFGDLIFKVYRDKLKNICYRTHVWFLLEIATPVAFKRNNMTYIFKSMLEDEHTDWERIYSYYDAVGPDEFGSISKYFDKYRDQLLSRNYDMI